MSKNLETIHHAGGTTIYPLVKTWMNAKYHPKNYEVNNQPSETIPDQTMSIRTILDRYSRGLPIGGSKEPMWQEDDDFNDLPDPRTLDLAERQEMAEIAKIELKSLKSKYPKKTASPLGDGRGNGGEADAPLASEGDGTEPKH